VGIIIHPAPKRQIWGGKQNDGLSASSIEKRTLIRDALYLNTFPSYRFDQRLGKTTNWSPSTRGSELKCIGRNINSLGIISCLERK